MACIVFLSLAIWHATSSYRLYKVDRMISSTYANFSFFPLISQPGVVYIWWTHENKKTWRRSFYTKDVRKEGVSFKRRKTERRERILPLPLEWYSFLLLSWWSFPGPPGNSPPPPPPAGFIDWRRLSHARVSRRPGYFRIHFIIFLFAYFPFFFFIFKSIAIRIYTCRQTRNFEKFKKREIKRLFSFYWRCVINDFSLVWSNDQLLQTDTRAFICIRCRADDERGRELLLLLSCRA